MRLPVRPTHRGTGGSVPESFEVFFEEHSSKVFGVMCLVSGNRQEAEEKCLVAASPVVASEHSGLPEHPEEHRSERPILFAVSQKFGEGAHCRRSIDDYQSHGGNNQNRIHEHAKNGDEDITRSLLSLDVAS